MIKAKSADETATAAESLKQKNRMDEQILYFYFITSWPIVSQTNPTPSGWVIWNSI